MIIHRFFNLNLNMGIFRNLFDFMRSKFLTDVDKMNFLLVGLDNSGKSTILQRLKPKKANIVETTPTVGFTTEEFIRDGVRFCAFDMSGQGRYRDLWDSQFGTCEGIIFVIDSSDRLRLVLAKDELDHMLSSVDLKNRKVPYLFLANKMDLREASPPIEIISIMKLTEISKDHPDINWNIVSTNALTGLGLDDGIKWLIERMKQNRKNRKMNS